MARNSMQAVTVRDGNRISVDTVPVPEPGAGEVRIRVEACGICGSDLHLLEQGGAASGHIPGHEICGTVEALGPGVETVAEGTRVAIEPLSPCGDCDACSRGDRQLCAALEIYGVHLAGGLAEYAVVRADTAFAFDSGLAPEVASLCEPVAVAVHGFARAGAARGDLVLIQGAGSIGLVACAVGRSLGLRVWQTARYEHQAALAAELGAERVLEEADASPRGLGKLARRHDFDAVIETVGGRADTLLAASGAVRPGGTIVVLGMFLESPQIDPFALLQREATLRWSNCYSRVSDPPEFEQAVRIVEDERERLALLATHRFAFADAARAFETAAAKSAGAVKVSLGPSDSQ